MRLPIIKAVFHKELLELLRNRRTLMVMLGVPLLMYPLLAIAIAGVTRSTQEDLKSQLARVAVTNASSAPKLISMLKEKGSGIDVALEAEVEQALRQGRLDAVIDLPKGYEDDVLAGRDAKVEVRLDRSRTIAPIVEKKISHVLDQYERWVIGQRLAKRGVPEDLVHPLSRSNTDIASREQFFGTLMARMLPVLLLLTGMLGALYPAPSATTTERELGTLETLLVTPATRSELLTAKAGIVLLSGLLTALINMLSMSLVIWQTMSRYAKADEAMSIDPGALALAYLASVPTIIFFTALVLMVGLLARNLREANAYATPVMLIPIASMLIGLAEPKATAGLLVTPVANTTIIIKDVLSGHAHAGQFVLAFASSTLYAGLVISLAGRVFTNEQLVNPAWEPLSLRGLTSAGRARRKDRPRRLPAIDEVLMLFGVSILLLFYLSPAWSRYGLFRAVIPTELLVVLLPALVFGWIGRYRWREVFSWRPPRWAWIAGGALLGAGMVPWIEMANFFQSKVWAPNPELARSQMDLFLPAIKNHPILTVLITASLAGFCEEILFRGPIQTAMIRRFSPAVAISATALLFAGAHLDAQGIPLRFVIGIVLGWIVWRHGSIFPAMVCHAFYDGTALAMFAWSVHFQNGAAIRADEIPSPFTPTGYAKLVIGVVAMVLGRYMLKMPRRDTGVPARASDTKLMEIITN